MIDAIINLLPIIVGAALVPIAPIIILLLLLGDGGLRKAMAFVAGNTTVRLIQGILFGPTLGAASEVDAQDGSDYIVSTLLLVVGILLLISAYKKWRREADPDDPPPQWMAAISGFSVLKAAGAGALYVLLSPKQWVLTLSAIGVIGEASLDGVANLGLYLFYVVAAQVFVLTPIGMWLIAPERTAQPLQAVQAWLDRYNRVILITVSLLFGLWFFFKGFNGLFA